MTGHFAWLMIERSYTSVNWSGSMLQWRALLEQAGTVEQLIQQVRNTQRGKLMACSLLLGG